MATLVATAVTELIPAKSKKLRTVNHDDLGGTRQDCATAERPVISALGSAPRSAAMTRPYHLPLIRAAL